MSFTLKDLEALREGWEFEAKKAAGRDGRGQLPDEFWPSYSAMANTNGGNIVLGVREHADGTLAIHGIMEPEPLLRDLWNLLGNRQKVSANILSKEDVRIETIDGVNVVLVRVPRAVREARPVYLGRDPFAGTYLRVHDGDRLASEDRVRRMIADSDRSRPRDARVLRGHGIDDLDGDTVGRYRNLLASRKADHPFLALDARGFLERLGCWARDRDAGAEGLTLAGLVLFGREDVIRSELPNWMLEYQEHSARSIREARRWDDRVFPDGTWNANLLQYYWRVFPRLVQGLQIPFELDRAGVRRAETPVHEGLREAFVNTIIHADYRGAPSIRIARRPDGFEFRNPGLPLVSIEQMRRGGESQCRNPTIQQVLVLVGLGERAGSGVPTILNAWRDQQWRPPDIEIEPEKDLTTLFLATVSLLPQEALDELQDRFSERFVALGANERIAVATAHVESKVTNRRMQELCALHPRDITLLFGELVRDGFLVPHGDRQGAWYTVADSLPESSPQSLPQSLPQTPASPRQTSLFAHRDPVEAVRASRWASRADVDAAILLLAKGRFVTAEELATALARSPRTLREHYLRRLVADRKLKYKHPGRAALPGQAYRTVEPGDEI